MVSGVAGLCNRKHQVRDVKGETPRATKGLTSTKPPTPACWWVPTRPILSSLYTPGYSVDRLDTMARRMPESAIARSDGLVSEHSVWSTGECQ